MAAKPGAVGENNAGCIGACNFNVRQYFVVAAAYVNSHAFGFGGHALFIKDRKLHYVYNFLGIEEQTFVSNTTLKPGKYTLGMEFTREDAGQYGESNGKMALYIDDQKVAEGPMKT